MKKRFTEEQDPIRRSSQKTDQARRQKGENRPDHTKALH